MEWLYHKKPLFLMHWKDGKVPQSVQDKVVVIPGGDAPIRPSHSPIFKPALVPSARSHAMQQRGRPCMAPLSNASTLTIT